MLASDNKNLEQGLECYRIVTFYGAIVLTCATWPVGVVSAAPAKPITFTLETGVITPAGAVPFDQWITATSSTPVELAEGKEFSPTAVLEYCGGSQKGCPAIVEVAPPPKKPPQPPAACTDLPVTTTCSATVTTTALAGQKGVSVRVDIPPLRYNSAYRLRLSLKGKTELALTAEALQKVDLLFDAEIQKLAGTGRSPTAPEICLSLKTAVQSAFASENVQFAGPLEACALGTATSDQIRAMEARIKEARDARFELEDAQRSFTLATPDERDTVKEEVEAARASEKHARETLRGTVREVVGTNTWVPIPLGTAANATTTRAAHISLDAGLVYGWDLDESITYLGANIYTRPVNTDVSLASLKAEGGLSWRHRFSFTLGATIGSIEKNAQRKGIVGSSALVVGVGWRLTDVVRLSAGALVFKEENPNPLVTNDASLAVSPYIGLSFDIDVAKRFGNVFSGLPSGP